MGTQEVAVDYAPVHEYAIAHNLSYNELCAVVRSAIVSKPHVAIEVAKPSLSTDGVEGLNISINDYVKGVVRDIVCSADWYRDAEQEEKSKLTIENLCIRPVMVSSGRTHTLENCFTADVTFMGELKRVAWRLEFTHGRIIEAT